MDIPIDLQIRILSSNSVFVSLASQSLSGRSQAIVGLGFYNFPGLVLLSPSWQRESCMHVECGNARAKIKDASHALIIENHLAAPCMGAIPSALFNLAHTVENDERIV